MGVNDRLQAGLVEIPGPRPSLDLNQLRDPARVHPKLHPHDLAARSASDGADVARPIPADQIAHLFPVGLGFAGSGQRQKIFFRNRGIDRQHMLHRLLRRGRFRFGIFTLAGHGIVILILLGRPISQRHIDVPFEVLFKTRNFCPCEGHPDADRFG